MRAKSAITGAWPKSWLHVWGYFSSIIGRGRVVGATWLWTSQSKARGKQAVIAHQRAKAPWNFFVQLCCLEARDAAVFVAHCCCREIWHYGISGGVSESHYSSRRASIACLLSSANKLHKSSVWYQARVIRPSKPGYRIVVPREISAKRHSFRFVYLFFDSGGATAVSWIKHHICLQLTD